jgi:hypothetical protein
MTVDASALDFLGHLEREEAAVLTWGLVDGFFAEEELEERAESFLARVAAQGNGRPYSSGWDLIEALLEERLLWKVPDTERYRTRMAESVRLFARLRQIFPDPRNVAWRTAPNLVADYRLVIRPRLYPIRDIRPSLLLQRVRGQTTLSPVQEAVIRALVRSGMEDERRLAAFQVRATERLLREAGLDRAAGTVISAGTGSGKTLAFYLPAYVAMSARLSTEHWTKCLALYPRNELLKDQLREALGNARRIATALAANGKRKFVVAALYGDVPYKGQKVLTGQLDSWPRLTIRGRTAYECPFVRCPHCGTNMAWFEVDIQHGLERLVCSDPRCTETVEPDEIRLTRERMLAEPPDVLFTSTEMLNQRLSSGRFARLFGVGVRADRRPEFVLIDEVHAYEGLHGAHVALLLRRWRRATDAHPHYVGLSATLADAPRFFAELVGIGPGDVAEVWPEADELRGEGAEYMLALRGDPSSGTSLLSTTIQALMLQRRVLASDPSDYFGTRVFGFTDNLDVINRLYHNLLDAEGWNAFRRPNPAKPFGSLANLRSTTLPNARERFEVGQNWALPEDIGHVLSPGSRVRVARTSSQDVGVDANAGIVVATSALEVGFDDPEVGAILQHKAPQSPAAFLQRKGRAGRRQSMRPWTTVVLSDYGRDRAAYQAYDQLFSPRLPARYLPLRNRAVLKMQATFALCDWLARRIPGNQLPDPWSDFSQPASEIQNPRVAADVAARQALYAQYLRALLEQDSVREEFAHFLRRCLAIDEDEVGAILWEPPRSLMTEAVPTLLRRLERGWRRADATGLEAYVWRSPLPEFLPRTLFSDLQLPEVLIRIPTQGQNPGRIEAMPVAQALREFAPGRVSRRFGVHHGRERYWIAPGNGSDVSIDTFCPAGDRQELGQFGFLNADGVEDHVVTFRPHAIDIALTPLNVQQSSNSFLRWSLEIVPTADGHEMDIPDGTRWLGILRTVSIHSHHLGLPVEVRRFSRGATASIGRGQGAQVIQSLRFVCTGPLGDTIPAAVGFVGDVDGIQVRFRYPARIYELVARDPRLVRGLRTALFRHQIRSASVLEGIANDFQREWLAQVYLSAITAEALRRSLTLEEADATLHAGTSSTTTREVLRTILQWSESNDEIDGADQSVDQELPRRLEELLDLLDQGIVRVLLHETASVLWTDIMEDWESWLQIRFKSTLGTAFVEAAQSLCPRMGEGTLILDLPVRPQHDADDDREPGCNEDELWLTESAIGGGGFVEEFLSRYVEDPRKFFRLLDAALSPSDLEIVSEELNRTLAYVACDSGIFQGLRTAFAGVRDAASHTESVRALNALRAELSRHGIQPTPTLLISLGVRVLRPGTTADTDRFLARAIEEWQAAEERLGIDIDARVFALVRSSDDALEQALPIDQRLDEDSVTTAWRYGVLYGMFWPRGAQIRSESLRAWNPFERLPDCDRLLALAVVPRLAREVSLSTPRWFEELADVLVQTGVVELVGRVDQTTHMAEALLRIGAESIDSEALLIHARVTGVRRESNRILAEIELPEAFQ